MFPAAPNAAGTLVFLQGTGGPDPVPAETIRWMLAQDPVLEGYSVLDVTWAAGAAPDVSVVPALPPRYQPVTPSGPMELDAAERGLALAGLDLVTAPPLHRPPQASADGIQTGENSGASAAPREDDPAAFEAEEENLLGSSLQRLTLNLVTDVAIRRRVPLTEAASDFSRSIIYYLRHGAEARTAITHALRMANQDGPVILFGHSLGGVAALDLVTAPEWIAEGVRVDLLVTAGSQSPWLYLLGGLAHLAPGGQGTLPVPWLNFWDERDLLSFCSERVFAGHGGRITDEEVTSGEPFPGSHSAYFANPDVYRAIRRELETSQQG
ncbi:hypothetical protein MUG94_00220 [Arthrobacter gengyunqii]|uniref:Alpha/beta hydrolase n=1 Tax=Arthrobacter gengyunqii TaxID=2886940 RepID=A0A9X1S6G1_9MICC|nr:hypothetical protein [Arthrobacter gengyunqii]MCC3268887.1 hypothetical protein [Arthrobacter gengyunqii]UOY96268.1 hypothetical protein MUG94_00220 [Arthrobacter gengyunqii]